MIQAKSVPGRQDLKEMKTSTSQHSQVWSLPMIILD
jgi:hypothetical protein